MSTNDIIPDEKPLAFGRQAEIFGLGEGRVLKLYLGKWPESARQEFTISTLSYTRGARTPQPLELVEKDGRPGIVFEKVDGPSLLRLLGARPWQVRQMAREFAELHHTVHACNALELPPVRPELEKNIQSRQQIQESSRLALLEIINKLPDGDSLIHGDFHPDNVMVTNHGMVIIDWQNGIRGCPLADVARTTIMLRVGEPVGKMSIGLRILARFLRDIFRTAYVNEYFLHSPYSKNDLPSWELVLAAQRIGDCIPGEEAKLVRFIERNLPRK